MGRKSTYQLVKHIPSKGLHQKNTTIIDHDNKNIFIAISKNASTSLRGTIKNLSVVDKFENLDGYDCVVILRDPIGRFLSAYEESLYKRSTVPKHIKNVKDLSLQMNLVLDELLSGNYFDLHLMPQIWFITDNNGQLLPITKVIDFANLSGELKGKCNLKIVHNNTTRASHKTQLEKALNQDIINKINDLYYLDNIIIQILKLTK